MVGMDTSVGVCWVRRRRRKGRSTGRSPRCMGVVGIVMEVVMEITVMVFLILALLLSL
jgi:hypothetical protein